LHTGQDHVGCVDGRRLAWLPAAPEDGLEADASNVRIAKAKLNGVPEMVEILAGYGHRQRDRNAQRLAAFDRAETGAAEVPPAEFALPRFLWPVKLQIELKPSTLHHLPELLGECLVVGDSDAIRIQENVVDSRIGMAPGE